MLKMIKLIARKEFTEMPYLQAICERLVGNLAASSAARPPLPSLPVL